MAAIRQSQRTARINRKTTETNITLELNLDGAGSYAIDVPVPFLKHMLELFAKHGLFDLQVRAKGDLHIDLHHTNEDLGLALGQAFRQALGEKRGIRRMGSAFVPMDETLARVRVVADVSGRPHFRLDWAPGRKPAEFRRGEGISYGLEDAKHFLESFSACSGLTLHVDVLKAGGDAHHLLEAVFKALGRALREAVDLDPRVRGVPSTKGKL